jgi:hypothetical protein
MKTMGQATELRNGERPVAKKAKFLGFEQSLKLDLSVGFSIM